MGIQMAFPGSAGFRTAFKAWDCVRQLLMLMVPCSLPNKAPSANVAMRVTVSTKPWPASESLALALTVDILSLPCAADPQHRARQGKVRWHRWLWVQAGLSSVQLLV